MERPVTTEQGYCGKTKCTINSVFPTIDFTNDNEYKNPFAL